MANATRTSGGQINLAGANDALFLKVYGGEVLAAFKRKCVMYDRHTVRTITSGKTAQFPATWRTGAAYHVPGVEIVGAQQVGANERTINIDDVLLSDTYITELDEAKNHYDFRSIVSMEQGQAIARLMDRQLLQLATIAARASATVTGGDGGTVTTNASANTTAVALAAAAFATAQAFDEKDVPDDRRYLALRPAQYYLLTQGTVSQNRDYNGVGSIALGTIPMVAGLEIVKSNQVPSATVTALTGENNTYSGLFNTLAGVAWHPNAIGTVKLRDLKVETMWDMRRQANLLIAKVLCGHGILRPECAAEIRTAVPT